MTKVTNLLERMNSDHDDRQKIAKAIRSGNSGNLIIGEVLHTRVINGKNIDVLETWLQTQGLRLPDKSTRSKYRGAYEAWVHNAGMQLGETYQHPDFTNDAGEQINMTLEGVSTITLYEARNMIDRLNPTKTLAWLYTASAQEVRDAAAGKNQELEPQQEFRTVKLPKETMEELKSLEGLAFTGYNRQEVMSFLIMFMRDLYERNPEGIVNTIKTYFGEYEPDA